MKTVTQHLRDHLLGKGTTLKELQASEWSSLFETLMRNRLIMGAYRYGCLGQPGKLDYDRVGYAIRCLQRYEDTGNLECLVDIANLALVEFVEGRHPNRHFKATDDEDHAEEKAKAVDSLLKTAKEIREDGGVVNFLEKHRMRDFRG